MRPLLLAIAVVAALPDAQAQIRTNPGFYSKSVPRNDDGSAPAEPLGWTLNFFGRLRNVAYVNNNGNLTFDAPLSDFTPFGLTGVSREIIAPFFADVDTRNAQSRLVTYGSDLVDGRRAFAANYIDVGYYNQRADKLNSFQVVLIQREDTGTGNFDIEFNYARIAWETGEASGGTAGFGGTSAAVGWSNGSGLPGTSFELPGSLVPGSFLDTGSFSLTRGRTPGLTNVSGRWVFRGRGGQIIQSLNMITGCPLPNATVGRPYAFRFEATGSRPPYRWSILADPDSNTGGLTMSPNGILSGTVAASNAFGFTVRVAATDEDGEVSVSRRCSISTDPAVLSFRTGASLPQGSVGNRYETRLTAEGASGALRYQLASTGVPGLNLNSNGVLSGTPFLAGTYPIQVVARAETADRAVPATKRFTVTVQPNELSVRASCPLPNATGGVPYLYRFEARGGSGPYRWRALGTLPPGLTLHPDGSLLGQPSVPHWWLFDVAVEDERGNQAQLGCGLVVLFPELRVSNACPLPSGLVGSAYSQRLAATGGSGPYNWTLVGGSLPAGLRLSSDGTLSGTPQAAGNALFRLRVGDSRGQTSAAGCNLTVQGGSFGISSCPLPNAYAGEPYAFQLSASGGSEPYFFGEGGPLPAGLRVSITGSLAGTLSQPGTYPLSLRVADAAGRSATRTCDLVVRPQALRLTSDCPEQGATLGQPFQFPFTAAGGAEPYMYLLTGEPPAGVRLMPNGMMSGTPTEAGLFPFLITVRDRAGQSTTQYCELPVVLPELPEVRITGVPATLAPASAGPRVIVELARAYPLPLEGELALEVTPDTGSPVASIDQADPLVRFANGQRTVPFALRAGERQFPVALTSTGTVASVLTFRVTRIGINGTGSSRQASATTRIARTAPVLTNVCYAPSGTTGFDIDISGYSTTRDLTRADLTLGANTFAVDLNAAAQDFFGSAESLRTGGTFRVRAPYRLTQGNPQSLGQGTAIIRNSAGASPSRPIARCQ